MHDLTGKVLLITGIGFRAEGFGNGTAMATLFARQGATVFGCDIKLDAANKAVEMIKKDAAVRRNRQDSGECVEVIQEPVDVTKMSSCKRFVEACMARHGKIDILKERTNLCNRVMHCIFHFGTSYASKRPFARERKGKGSNVV